MKETDDEKMVKISLHTIFTCVLLFKANTASGSNSEQIFEKAEELTDMILKKYS